MPVSRRHLLLGGLALPVFGAKAPPERPNLLLVLADDLPAWMLGCYGNREVRTPNLDRLAQTGARMARHFACAAVPGPGRGTLLTGRTPMQLGDASTPEVAGSDTGKLLAGLGYVVQAGDTGAAVAFLEAQAPGKPFFLTAGFPALRPPYEGVAAKYLDSYAQSKFDTLNLERGAAASAQAGKEMLADITGNVRKAAAAVTALDDEVAAMLNALSRKRLLESTMVVVTSSCGALLGRHGLWGAGDASEPANLYDESVATPLIWSWLGHVPTQAVRPEMVSAYDFVPTLCDVLGVDAPGNNLCGRSYLPLLTGKPLPKKQPWRTTVFAHYASADMARTDRYKLVLRDGGKSPGELYDLTADPGERVNQYGNQQFLTVRTSLAQAASGWKQRYGQ